MEATTPQLATQNRLSRDLKRALIDLHHFARELTDTSTHQDTSEIASPAQRSINSGISEDPMIPWIKGAMSILSIVAVGALLYTIKDLAGL